MRADVLDALWQRLAEQEDQEGETSRLLLGTPRQTPAFLAAKIKTVPIPDPAMIRGLVTSLDSEDFQQREAATNELVKLGKLAERDLNKALMTKPSPEMKRRIAELFKEHHLTDTLSPDMRRAALGIRVLEQLGTDAARSVLEDVANGPKGAWLTEEAGAALRRSR